MITRTEAFTGLYAAWRLLLRDARATSLFDATPLGAVKSFFCALIVLPGYALIVTFVHTKTATDVNWFRFFLVEAIAYVITWCAWPLLMFYIATALDRSRDFLLYLTALNWSAGPQMLIWLFVLFLAFSGVFPQELVVVANLVALAVILMYHLFILRTTLRLTFLVALGLVIGEAIVSQFIDQARGAMLN